MSPVIQAIFERALKTFAQTLLATIGVNQLNLLSASFTNALQIAASAAVLSVLTSIVSTQIGQSGPSLATETVAPTAVAGS